MKLLSNQVLILPAVTEEKIGSFILAESAKESDNTGKVISVGPGKLSKDSTIVIDMTVAAEDLVMFVPDRAVSVTVNGLKHIIVSEDDIVAVL